MKNAINVSNQMNEAKNRVEKLNIQNQEDLPVDVNFTRPEDMLNFYK